MKRMEKELLFPLVDALDCPMRITNKNELERAYPGDIAEYVLDKIRLPLQCDLLASGFGISTAWVLMRIRGDLGIMVGHDVSERCVYAHVINLSKVHVPGQHSTKTYRVVRDLLHQQGAIVASYSRDSHGTNWANKNGKNGSSVDRHTDTASEGITWIHTDKS